MIFGRDPPGGGLKLGGPPVDNVAIDVEGERTLFRLAGLSLVVGLGISMACFRSLRLTVMVFWVALLAAGIGMAAVYWTGSSVDAVMLSMPSLVYVLAISGAIHIINYYHDAIRETGLPGPRTGPGARLVPLHDGRHDHRPRAGVALPQPRDPDQQVRHLFGHRGAGHVGPVVLAPAGAAEQLPFPEVRRGARRQRRHGDEPTRSFPACGRRSAASSFATTWPSRSAAWW